MSNNINEYKNIMLENYKNLIVNYEESRELYDKIIKEYEYLLDNITEVKCSRVVGYNTLGGEQMVWRLYSLEGKMLYQSDISENNTSCTLNLGTVLLPGTWFRVSCITSNSSVEEVYSDEILLYTPDSNATAYYQYNYGLEAFKFSYNGVVPPVYTPNAEPYLKASAILLKNDSSTITKYGLYTLEGVQLYESGRFSRGETCRINFEEVGIEINATLRVKALVSAGSDDLCEVIVQHIPHTDYVGQFSLCGNTINNILVYKGSYSLIPDPSKVAKADQIMAYNDSTMGAEFSIVLLDGTSIYESDKKYQWEKLIINLNDLDIEPGTYVRLKSVLIAKDLTSEMAIKYSPDTGGTAYFELNGRAAIPNSHELNYYGVLSSETTPPLLKCSSIVVHNDSNMITKWSFISNGQTIYTSGRCRINKTSTLDLANISSVSKGTRFLLKANAIAGKDDTAYVTIEYDPDINVIAHFRFDGPATKTILMYEGSTNIQ